MSFNACFFSGVKTIFFMNFIPSKDKLSNTRKKLLVSFQKSLGIHFKDISLLDLAFHHRSFSNETSKKDLSQCLIAVS